MRLTPATRALLGTRALLDRTTRSALVRELIDEGLAARANARANAKPSDRATIIDSSAYGREHRVTVEIDVPAEKDHEATKARVATRNAAVLNPPCACGATLEELENQSPVRVSASVSAARPTAAGTERFGRIVPSVSPGRPPAGRGRATVHLTMNHKSDCKGAA